MGCFFSDPLDCSFDGVSANLFTNMTIRARVLDVYDGDTITVGIIYRGIRFKQQMRLYLIDAPEMKPLLCTPNRSIHVEAAIHVRDILRSHILDKKVTLVLKNSYDKYGRLLGDVVIDGININTMLISRGLVKPYSGGKKEEFSLDDLKRILQSD